MNPSLSGWIPKFFTLFTKEKILLKNKGSKFFYEALKSTGFIYGFSVDSVLKLPANRLQLTTDEYTKINLFHALLFSFFINNPKANYNDAIDCIIAFYKLFEKGKTSFLKKLSFSKSPTDTLEQLFFSRLQEINSVSEKNTASLLTYALLYIDVLSFQKFIQEEANLDQVKNYSQNYETILIDCCFLTLQAKQNKTADDVQLIDLYQSSKEYVLETHHTSLKQMSHGFSNFNYFEKKYILDLCTLAVWEDKKLDRSERVFLNQIATLMQFPSNIINQNIADIKQFSEKNNTKIKLFEYNHPINQLYKNAFETVKLLIIRNSKRLTQELLESKELLVLLGQSTLRNLSNEEKKKVKNQLLDICKTVPSLTIFLVPGGSLLLPLLIKLIPALLPSAFNENKIEK